MGQRHRARPLRCTGRRGDGSGGSGAAPALLAGPTFEALHCRTCWEEEDCEDGGQLVAPCACTGSMRMVHARCLAAWQQQLRASKGIAAARRCDVCKTAWLRAHQPEIGPTNWRQMLRDLGRKVPWAALLEVRAGRGALNSEMLGAAIAWRSHWRARVCSRHGNLRACRHSVFVCC